MQKQLARHQANESIVIICWNSFAN